MSRLDPAVDRLLLDRLGPAHPNLEFARAVAAHLGAAPTAVWSQRGAAERVVELLQPQYNTIDAEELARAPELVASLFQNADLLVPSDKGSHAIAALVMQAIERLVDG
jgi:hypothetical protein